MDHLATASLCLVAGAESTFLSPALSPSELPVPTEPKPISPEDRALESDDAASSADGDLQGGAVETWSDSRLVAAVRDNPPDAGALDELAQRYWKPLFGRCQLLTLNREEAGDLAQEAWCRILKSRSNLKPEGNFPGYLYTIAMNLWRDRCRSHRRAGAMAVPRLVSLDASPANCEGEKISFAEAVPDLAALELEQQARLMGDVDCALERLSPVLRGVLVARFLTGESCAEIARRHGRTEQTISGWVRQAIHEIKTTLSEMRGGPSL